MNIRALMAYDLLTIIIDIQRNLNYLWSNSIKNQTRRLKYSRSSMGTKSKTQLSDWIMQYNESNLKAYTPRKRDSKMSGRKTDFEERLTIIEELIKHDVNSVGRLKNTILVTNKFMAGIKSIAKAVMTQNHFVIAEAKAKPEEKWTEVDRLKAENRLLRAQLEKQEMEIAFAKN